MVDRANTFPSLCFRGFPLFGRDLNRGIGACQRWLSLLIAIVSPTVPSSRLSNSCPIFPHLLGAPLPNPESMAFCPATFDCDAFIAGLSVSVGVLQFCHQYPTAVSCFTSGRVLVCQAAADGYPMPTTHSVRQNACLIAEVGEDCTHDLGLGCACHPRMEHGRILGHTVAH